MSGNAIERAAVLAPSQIRHLLRVTHATSRHPLRDIVVLLLGLSCGMRITEIAQITVADILFPSGTVRTEVSLRAAITKGCRQRSIYLSSEKLVSAIDLYLVDRVTNGLGVTLQPHVYRGLYPDLPVILSRRGYPFSLNRKLRRNANGAVVEYWAADTLQAYVSGLYRAAGIKGGSSHSGRRTFATRLLKRGASIEQVQLLLGHESIDQTGAYIEIDRAVLRLAFETVI